MLIEGKQQKSGDENSAKNREENLSLHDCTSSALCFVSFRFLSVIRWGWRSWRFASCLVVFSSIIYILFVSKDFANIRNLEKQRCMELEEN